MGVPIKLHININLDSLNRQISTNARPVFGIWWSHEDISYPESGWLDNGLDLFGVWLTAIERLMKGSLKEDLVFFAGNYEIEIFKTKNKEWVRLVLREGYEVNVKISSLVEEILKAVNIAMNTLEQNNIKGDHFDRLDNIKKRLLRVLAN